MFFDAAAVDRLLPYDVLMDALRRDLPKPCATPLRAVHQVAEDGDLLLMMPSWREKQAVGVKLLTLFPSNQPRNLPTIQGVYVLFDGDGGAPLAVLDGTRLTLRRTAALCALATEVLAEAKAQTLLVVGTGALAPHVVQAHAAARPWARIQIWGRNQDALADVAGPLRDLGVRVEIAADLQSAAQGADVISCATSSTQPFLKADWVRPGQHINLLGAYTERMFEAEPALVARTSLFADDRPAVLAESGEVIAAIRQGLIAPDAILGDIGEILSQPRQRAAGEITLFKSVGFGALDLSAATALVAQVKR